jgi:SAM-dependent methyltransferase
MPASADRPYPPLELMDRVFSVGQWNDPYRLYEEMGAETKTAILRMLPDDWSFEGKRVLDFGCGAGRTLRHFLTEAEQGEFWGTDIDAPSIEWLQRELCPPLHAWRSAHGTPLGLEHGSFDLIWAISVFTHLPYPSSFAWLLELHNLLKPDGYLIATYYGRWNSEYLALEPWVEDRIGMNVLNHWRPWDDGGPDVLMSDWWVREHWGRAFEILDVAPQIHNFTWVLMRKRDVELTVEDLERPSDDPREYQALRHNIRQLQREIDMFRGYLRDAQAERDAALAGQRQEYEGSLSWRLTSPLRASAKTARRLRDRRRSQPAR